MRIYSFLPAATEIIFALGLGDQVCGVTTECDFPSEARRKRIVVDSFLDPTTMGQGEIDARVVESMSHGHALYRIDRGLLAEQKPDVIVTQELCDVCSVSLRDVLRTVSELSERCRVVSLAPRGLFGVLDDIMTVGRACGVEDRATLLVALLKKRIIAVADRTKNLTRKSVFCMEWFDPIFASGHWVPEIVRLAGGVDELCLEGKNSRKIAWKDVRENDPEILVLIPCGFDLRRTKSDIPILQNLPGWEQLKAVRTGRVYAADGSSYFSRPGPRLVEGLEMMACMLHPEVFGDVLLTGRAERIDPAALISKEQMLRADRSC